MRTIWAVFFVSTLWSLYACLATAASMVAWQRLVLPGFSDLSTTWPFYGGLLVLFVALSSAILLLVIAAQFVVKVWKS
jgi:hypothetical protein